MIPKKRLWPLALVLWVCCGAIVWAQATVSYPNPGITFDGTSVTLQGNGLFPAGTAGAPSIAWAADADGSGTGFYRNGTNIVELVNNGVANTRWNTSGLLIISDTLGLFFGASADLELIRGGTTGALRILGGTTPTQSGTTCGTGPTLSGNNTLGSVTLGTTPGLPCTIVFNGTWTNAPKCFLDPEVLTTGTTTVRATGISTTQFVITTTAALVATDKVSWLCTAN